MENDDESWYILAKYLPEFSTHEHNMPDCSKSPRHTCQKALMWDDRQNSSVPSYTRHFRPRFCVSLQTTQSLLVPMHINTVEDGTQSRRKSRSTLLAICWSQIHWSFKRQKCGKTQGINSDAVTNRERVLAPNGLAATNMLPLVPHSTYPSVFRYNMKSCPNAITPPPKSNVMPPLHLKHTEHHVVSKR